MSNKFWPLSLGRQNSHDDERYVVDVASCVLTSGWYQNYHIVAEEIIRSKCLLRMKLE